jgi:23S rRNA pseudouridine1911/1915/1917 synthase
METRSVIIPEHLSGNRADMALARCFPDLSRTRIRRALDAGLATVDGRVLGAKDRIIGGENVTLCSPITRNPRPAARPMDLNILYEDDHLVAIDKPPGTVIHPAPHVAETLVEALLAHTGGNLAEGTECHRPGVVHRLDRDTSGVLLFAKTDGALRSLLRQFKERTAKKTYVALAAGLCEKLSGTVDAPIGRDPRRRTRMAVLPFGGREARTDWSAVPLPKKNFTHFTLRPRTGRTHQIRVHLAFLGHPILGDRLYGFDFRRFFPVPRILLHAVQLEIQHPLSGQSLTISASIPGDIATLLDPGGK